MAASDPAVPAPAPARGRSTGRFARTRRQGGPRRVSWFLVLPGLFCLFAFHIVPSVAGGWYAFTDWDGLSQAHWIGLDNFSRVFSNPTSKNALLHTFELGGAFFVLANAIGLGLALALNRTLKSRNALRSIFFLPVAMSPLAVAFIWQYIFDYDGALNRALGAVGLESWKHTWLGDPKWALWTVLVVLVWQFSGLTMVIYLAGLQGISDELIEASAVDGANTWTRFRRIVLPLLAPAITVAATLTMIYGLRVFDQVVALTGGGPVDSTETLATQVWKETFANGHFGYGAALSLILTAVIAVLSLGQLAVLRARERRI